MHCMTRVLQLTGTRVDTEILGIFVKIAGDSTAFPNETGSFVLCVTVC